MNEVKTSTNEAGHRILTVTTEPGATTEGPITWTWNLTEEPDAFMHASTAVIRELCKQVFLLEADRNQWQRRAETAGAAATRHAQQFARRVSELEEQVARVRALHRRTDDGWCEGCSQQPDGQWPCKTLRALVTAPPLEPTPEGDHGPYVTKSGRILTDADVEALADEAEAGYDVSGLTGKPSRRA